MSDDAKQDKGNQRTTEHHFWLTIGRVAAVATLVGLGIALSPFLVDRIRFDNHPDCIFSKLGDEFPPGYEEVVTCPSGARLMITTPDGYGSSAISGKVSAASADVDIVLELRNPDPGRSPLLIRPSAQPGCFGQYIEAAGYEPYSMIDTANIVRFVDDGVAKRFVGYEDCEPGSLASLGTGKQIVIQYAAAQ